MSEILRISQQAQQLRDRFRLSDPHQLCEKLGILLSYRPMGRKPEDCKGFFICYCRIPLIMINSDLSEEMQRIVCAHELGHAVLHRKEAAAAGFQEISLFRTVDKKEQEANLFASELLLSDEAVLAVLNEDHTFFEAAAQLAVPADLLDFKFRILKKKGYALTESPVNARNVYLKDLPDGGRRYDDF